MSFMEGGVNEGVIWYTAHVFVQALGSMFFMCTLLVQEHMQMAFAGPSHRSWVIHKTLGTLLYLLFSDRGAGFTILLLGNQ